MIDEDVVEEVVEFGSGEIVEVVYVGLEMAMMRARSNYVAGRIEVDEFEREVDRILRKREALKRRSVRPRS